MIEFRSVSYRYPDGPLALDNVNLKIEPGSFVGIVGRNGAGKTTLVKCINGLIKPTSGEVLVDGVRTRDVSVAKMAGKVGLVFQNSDNQLFSTSVWEELDFSLKNMGVAEEERATMIEETLESLNLLELKDSSPFLLSGGERKRTAFASLICMGQDIFVVDEPTQGQDAIQRNAIEALLKDLHEKGKTIILISHDLDFLMRLSKRIIIMEKGRILLDGNIGDVFSSPQKLEFEKLSPTQDIELKWFIKENFTEVEDPFLLDNNEMIDYIINRLEGKKANVD
ncbi:MAG: energy-coupling factor ABC transporter ATP-binding protein [Candidatus Hodarchaeota archaeon]